MTRQRSRDQERVPPVGMGLLVRSSFLIGCEDDTIPVRKIGRSWQRVVTAADPPISIQGVHVSIVSERLVAQIGRTDGW